MLKFAAVSLLAVGAAGAGWLWWQGIPLSEAGAVAQCTLQQGVYLKEGPTQRDYVAFMNQSPVNAERLTSGQALGCYPEGGCEPNTAAAVAALEGQMIRWTANAGGNLLAGNVMDMLGLDAESGARARQSEGEFCLNRLGERRRALIGATYP